MSGTTPAFEYGRSLGLIQRGINKMFSEIQRGMVVGLQGPQTPEDHEALRVRRYQRRIDDERRQGLAFVAREARKARKELGLS